MFKPRYIPAEEAEERIVTLWRKERSAYADVFNTAIDACQTIILDMYDKSSEDVVPVVRCKDCEFYTEEKRYCKRLGLHGAFDSNGYCSHAERSKDGQT